MRCGYGRRYHTVQYLSGAFKGSHIKTDGSRQHGVCKGQHHARYCAPAPSRCGYCFTSLSRVSDGYAGADDRGLLSWNRCESSIRDDVFVDRFSHVEQLKRMGAQIDLQHSCAKVTGKAVLEGAEVMATDLRAGAAMMIAGLKASGITRINGVQQIDRGYESLETKLGMLGANIRRLRLF